MWDPDSAEAEDERARAGLPASVGARRSLTRPILDRMVDPLTAARTSARTLDEDRQGDPRTIGLLRDSLGTLNHMLNEAREAVPRSVETADGPILSKWDQGYVNAIRDHDECCGTLRNHRPVVDVCPDCGRSDEHAAPCTAAFRVRLASYPPRSEETTMTEPRTPDDMVERLREAIRRHRDAQPTHEVEDKYHDIYEAAHRCDEDCAEAIAAVLAAPRSVETAGLDVDDLAYAIAAVEDGPGWTPWSDERTNAALIAKAYEVIHSRKPGTDRALASAALSDTRETPE